MTSPQITITGAHLLAVAEFYGELLEEGDSLWLAYETDGETLAVTASYEDGTVGERRLFGPHIGDAVLARDVPR